MIASLEIQNLKCGGCANTITNKLNDVEGITDLNVDHSNDTVSFFYENENTLLEAKKLLTNIGYPVIGDKNAITTKAKSFVSCAIGRINK